MYNLIQLVDDLERLTKWGSSKAAINMDQVDAELATKAA